MEKISVHLPHETLEAIDAAAEDSGVSRSAYLRSIVESQGEGSRSMQPDQEKGTASEETSDLRQWIEDLETTVRRLEAEKSQLVLDRARYHALALRNLKESRRVEQSRPNREIEVS